MGCFVPDGRPSIRQLSTAAYVRLLWPLLKMEWHDVRPAPCATRGRWFARSYLQDQSGEDNMSIVKVVEVIAQSQTSWDDAVQKALTEVSATVNNIKEIWVSGMKAVVEDNRIVEYRLTAKVSFVGVHE